MLKRKAMNLLEEWARSKVRRGMLVTGSRQVGKTYLIRAFAKAHYRHFAEINFLENKTAVDMFEAADNTADLVKGISILTETELIPGKTLIFFDEVQACKEIVTAVKFLVEQTDFHFILSGSLLGVELKNIKSVPVGYMDTVTMYPLDFEEYCGAFGVTDDILSDVRESFLARSPVPDFIHDRLTKLFYEYLIVGGMPAVVSSFAETKNLATVRRIQQNLILQNKQDISKYNERDSLNIKNIYDLIPAELNNQNKRFILKDMKERAKFREYKDNFVWLAEAGVALPTYNVDEPKYPLMLSRSSNLFKLFMSDVGLLTSTFMRDTSIRILSKNPNVNYGAIFENAVAQELVSQGFGLYYFKNKKIGELDFVIETVSGTVYPIEVKAGKDYKRHNALNNVLSFPDYHVGTAIVLSERNVEVRDGIWYLPIYMVMCLGMLGLSDI
jgi:predicted AAA+ superfamily ATPase